MSTEQEEKIVIGIVCERSVDFGEELDQDGFLKNNSNVKVIKVPCSGHIQPIMIESALKKGAVGVFCTGCRIGDCHYREGNKFLRDRLLGKRMPKLKPTVDRRRVEAYWLSALEYDKLEELVAEFDRGCQALESEAGKAASGKG